MILTKEEILKKYSEGEIVIEPFCLELVQINSVDVRLGRDLWVAKGGFFDPYNPQEYSWEKIEPTRVGDFRANRKRLRVPGADFGHGVLEDDDEMFFLKGGHFYLATTLEKIGTASVGPDSPSIVAEMKAKSTIGRIGLTTAICAGLGDVDFKSRWALEVRVVNGRDVPLAVGTPIGQVKFSYGTPTAESYNGPDRYQNDDVVRFLPKPLKIVRSTDDQ